MKDNNPQVLKSYLSLLLLTSQAGIIWANHTPMPITCSKSSKIALWMMDKEGCPGSGSPHPQHAEGNQCGSSSPVPGSCQNQGFPSWLLPCPEARSRKEQKAASGYQPGATSSSSSPRTNVVAGAHHSRTRPSCFRGRNSSMANCMDPKACQKTQQHRTGKAAQ